MAITKYLCLTSVTVAMIFTFSHADVPELKLPPVAAPDKAEKNKSPKLVHKLSCEEGLKHLEPDSLRLSPDGRYLFAGLTKNRGVRRYNTLTWECSTVSGLPEVFSSDSRIFTYQDRDMYVVMGVADGRIVKKGTNDYSYGHLKAVSQSPKAIFTCAGDMNTPLRSTQKCGLSNLDSKLHGYTGEVCAAEFSPDGRLIAASFTDNTIRIWGVQSGALLNTLAWHISSVSSLAFTSDSTKLVSGSEDGSLAIWNVSSGEQIHELWGEGGMILDVAFSPDGLYAVSISDEGDVVVWDIKKGKSIRNIAIDSVKVGRAPLRHGTCRFSHDGTTIVVAYGNSMNGYVMVIDAASGNVLVRKGCPLLYGCK